MVKRKNKGALWMMAQLPFPDEEYIEYGEKINFNQAINDKLKAKKNIIELGLWKEFKKNNIKILDIGSGNGNTLGSLPHINNQKLFGIEPSRSRYDFSKKQYPWVNFLNLTLEKADFLPESFDYIISFATFEHLRNPQLLVHRMYQWLKPDGKILLSFTNSGGLIPKLNLYEWRNTDPEHQWLPSKKTAFKLLDNEGFEVIKYFTYGGIPAPRGFFKEILNKLIKLFNMGDILYLVARKK